jgi:excisionase family DNA binding protein
MTGRLLNVDDAAQYLSVSTRTVRNFVEDGHLRPCRLPSTRHAGERSRRLLFDRADLDQLIETSKKAA